MGVAESGKIVRQELQFAYILDGARPMFRQLAISGKELLEQGKGVSFIASYRTQFDRVIRAESYSSLRERLQKKATETTAAQR